MIHGYVSHDAADKMCKSSYSLLVWNHISYIPFHVSCRCPGDSVSLANFEQFVMVSVGVCPCRNISGDMPRVRF